jgi:16S rRNA (cytosine967-C5)-methyltransferase
LAQLTPRANRAGLISVETRLLDPGKETGMLADLAGKCDRVIVDAPCSGSGTWRRSPELRWRLTPARLERFQTDQARLLDIAAPLVAQGGSLLYAVCALTAAEGRDQIASFFARHDGWRAVPVGLPPLTGRAAGDGWLLTPGRDNCDGFFMARLDRT